MGGGGRRRKQKDTKPFDNKKVQNLRNLLIVGFIRSCGDDGISMELPTKFFDFFNYYYHKFDRWNWDYFRTNWTSKRGDMITIKRGKKEKSVWKNMYGIKHIKFNINSDGKPMKFEWKLRLLDRKQIESMKKSEDEDINKEIEY